MVYKLSSKGWNGILFTQERVGKNGITFKILKFQTIYNCYKDPQPFLHLDESQLSRFDFMLRKTFIDELPQLINVIKGEMSLVGPRPLMALDENYLLSLDKRFIKRRLSKPGITGLAQVKGHYGQPKNSSDLTSRGLWDNYYAFHKNLKLYLYILTQTTVLLRFQFTEKLKTYFTPNTYVSRT